MSQPIAIGIDLGTTNSAVAHVDASGRSMMVPNAEDDLLTPSVVMFDDDEVIVGKEARRANTVHPEQVAEWVKRDVGAPTYSRPIRGEYLPPEVIQACILRRLKSDITSQLGPEIRTVITVPAHFDEPRRKSTADAGEMADLRVLDIVNEPTAAAMAFGEVHGYLTSDGEPRDEMTLLVYDLGGGTFDVTLLRLAPGDVRAIATDGDFQLGGHDWDMRLVDDVAESFQDEHGLDPRDEPAAFSRLYNGVLEAKHTLSARARAAVQVDHGGQSYEVEVTRDRFEELTADLLERTAYTTRQLLAESGLEWSDVSRLLLVGGSTRMPMVSKMLCEMTGIEPDHTVNPDEAVARGAALYAGYLLSKESGGRGPDFQVTNVNAHSLGVEGIDAETMRKQNFVLIRRNTQLPARFTERFTTKKEDQRTIAVKVLEGESTSPEDCHAIGRAAIRDLPPGLPQGWPVDVTFEYGTNGRLSVHAVVSGVGNEVALDIERESGLSAEGISGRRKAVDGQGGFDAFEALVDEALQEASGPSSTPPSRTAPESSPPGQPPGGTPPLKGADPSAPVPPPRAPDGANPPADGEEESSDPDREVRRRRRIPRWLITVVGFILSSIIGTLVGYLVVTRLFPSSGLPRIF